jgi:hypothetical protein
MLVAEVLAKPLSPDAIECTASRDEDHEDQNG